MALRCPTAHSFRAAACAAGNNPDKMILEAAGGAGPAAIARACLDLSRAHPVHRACAQGCVHRSWLLTSHAALPATHGSTHVLLRPAGEVACRAVEALSAPTRVWGHGACTPRWPSVSLVARCQYPGVPRVLIICLLMWTIRFWCHLRRGREAGEVVSPRARLGSFFALYKRLWRLSVQLNARQVQDNPKRLFRTKTI